MKKISIGNQYSKLSKVQMEIFQYRNKIMLNVTVPDNVNVGFHHQVTT